MKHGRRRADGEAARRGRRHQLVAAAKAAPRERELARTQARNNPLGAEAHIAIADAFERELDGLNANNVMLLARKLPICLTFDPLADKPQFAAAVAAAEVDLRAAAGGPNRDALRAALDALVHDSWTIKVAVITSHLATNLANVGPHLVPMLPELAMRVTNDPNATQTCDTSHALAQARDRYDADPVTEAGALVESMPAVLRDFVDETDPDDLDGAARAHAILAACAVACRADLAVVVTALSAGVVHPPPARHRGAKARRADVGQSDVAGMEGLRTAAEAQAGDVAAASCMFVAGMNVGDDVDEPTDDVEVALRQAWEAGGWEEWVWDLVLSFRDAVSSRAPFALTAEAAAKLVRGANRQRADCITTVSEHAVATRDAAAGQGAAGGDVWKRAAAAVVAAGNVPRDAGLAAAAAAKAAAAASWRRAHPRPQPDVAGLAAAVRRVRKEYPGAFDLVAFIRPAFDILIKLCPAHCLRQLIEYMEAAEPAKKEADRDAVAIAKQAAVFVATRLADSVGSAADGALLLGSALADGCHGLVLLAASGRLHFPWDLPSLGFARGSTDETCAGVYVRRVPGAENGKTDHPLHVRARAQSNVSWQLGAAKCVQYGVDDNFGVVCRLDTGTPFAYVANTICELVVLLVLSAPRLPGVVIAGDVAPPPPATPDLGIPERVARVGGLL